MREKKMPEIRFREFEGDWKEKAFENCASRLSIADNDPNLPNVEYEDIVSGGNRLNKDVRKKITHKKGLSFSDKNILFGKLRPYLRNLLMPSFSGVAVGDFWVLDPLENDRAFIFALIQGDSFQTAANISAGSKMPRSDWNTVANTHFIIPNALEEQKRIGSLFSALDRLIDRQRRKLEKLQTFKQAMLEKMFPKEGSLVPEIRFRGFQGDWEYKTFVNLATRLSLANDNPNLPSVEYEDIISGENRLNKDIHKKTVHKKGIFFSDKNILFGKLRPYLRNLLMPSFSGVAVGDFWVLDPLGNDRAFVFALVQGGSFQSVANISAGSKMPRSDWNTVANASFAIPKKIHEQKRIGSFFSTLDRLIESQQHKLAKLQTLKQSLLQKMFV